MKVSKGIELISPEKRRASLSMIQSFAGSYAVGGQTASRDAVLSMALPKESVDLLSKISLQPAEAQSIEQVLPKDSDYIYPIFRALSAETIPGYWVDFSKAGVLEKAVPLFYGQTVYKNHGESDGFWGCRQFDVEKWLGSVSQSIWDPKGEKVGNTPGVNVEMKIDALMSPRIARGLLMKPPAIHSCSETVLFDFEFSHPDLVEQERFYRNLGEEIDGQIVRYIVTEILELWELSLVFQGADRFAKQIPDDEDDPEEEYARGENNRQLSKPAPVARIDNQKEKTVKLTAEQKKTLGLDSHSGEEVADAIVLTAVDSLGARAVVGDQLLSAERAEVLRLATLAECSGDEKLPDAIATLIGKAGATELDALKKLYNERAEAKVPATCQQCGSHEIARGRSSVEAPNVVSNQVAPGKQVSIL